MRHRLNIHLLSALLIAFALATSALAQPADLVLRGGRVITVDKDWRIAQAIAIRDGRFLAVGDDAAIAGHIGPNTQVVELAGKTVVPGLIDSHLHQLSAGLNGPAAQLLGFEAVSSGLADMYTPRKLLGPVAPPGSPTFATSHSVLRPTRSTRGSIMMAVRRYGLGLRAGHKSNLVPRYRRLLQLLSQAPVARSSARRVLKPRPAISIIRPSDIA